MNGYISSIEQQTITNTAFRKVLYTARGMQLVLMSLVPGEDIGEEVHEDSDQFFRCEAGKGKVIVDGTEHVLSDGVAVIVPVGARHNIINTSETESLKLYTLYAPPHHKDGVVHMTKKEAEESEEHFDGVTTE